MRLQLPMQCIASMAPIIGGLVLQEVWPGPHNGLVSKCPGQSNAVLSKYSAYERAGGLETQEKPCNGASKLNKNKNTMGSFRSAVTIKSWHRSTSGVAVLTKHLAAGVAVPALLMRLRQQLIATCSVQHMPVGQKHRVALSSCAHTSRHNHTRIGPLHRFVQVTLIAVPSK